MTSKTVTITHRDSPFSRPYFMGHQLPLKKIMRNFCTHLITQNNLQLYLLTFNNSNKNYEKKLIIELTVIRNNGIY